MAARSIAARARPWIIGLIRNRRVRRAGAAVGRAIFGRPELPVTLVDPIASARRSGLPGVAQLGEALHARASARRLARLEAAGAPLVSVVMAARDAEATIEGAIESVLSQTYRTLELVVVDDASADRTAELIAQLAARDQRVRPVTRAAPGGAAAARNDGLAVARGDYVTFHDADDLSREDRIERQLHLLVVDRAARLVTCRYRRVDAAGETVVVNERAYRKCILTMMFPREEVLEAVGFLRADLPVGEDAEYYERIKAVFGEASERRVSTPLYDARFDPESLLFSHGSVEWLGPHELRYRQAEEHARSQVAWRETHREIERGARRPRVERDGALPSADG